MKVYRNLSEIPTLKPPITLTIGMFDGVHLGHRHLLSKLTTKKGSSVVLTFSNHPLTILQPDQLCSLLFTNEEKISLLQSCNINTVILLPFSEELKEMPYQKFIKMIHEAIPFHHLYLGENDSFGKNKEGHFANLQTLSPTFGFVTHQIEKLQIDSSIVSTSWIKQSLKDGNLTLAEKLLGRPLSLSTINKNLLKPGSYFVRIKYDHLNTFEETNIQIEKDNEFILKNPGMITIIKRN